jgi:hypothetical protein
MRSYPLALERLPSLNPFLEQGNSVTERLHDSLILQTENPTCETKERKTAGDASFVVFIPTTNS